MNIFGLKYKNVFGGKHVTHHRVFYLYFPFSNCAKSLISTAQKRIRAIYRAISIEAPHNDPEIPNTHPSTKNNKSPSPSFWKQNKNRLGWKICPLFPLFKTDLNDSIEMNRWFIFSRLTSIIFLLGKIDNVYFSALSEGLWYIFVFLLF